MVRNLSNMDCFGLRPRNDVYCFVVIARSVATKQSIIGNSFLFLKEIGRISLFLFH